MQVDKAVRRDGPLTAQRGGLIRVPPLLRGSRDHLRKAEAEAGVYRFVWDLQGASGPAGISSLVTLLMSGAENGETVTPPPFLPSEQQPHGGCTKHPYRPHLRVRPQQSSTAWGSARPAAWLLEPGFLPPCQWLVEGESGASVSAAGDGTCRCRAWGAFTQTLLGPPAGALASAVPPA